MLVTAFLPVYVSVKDRLGVKGRQRIRVEFAFAHIHSAWFRLAALHHFRASAHLHQSFMNDQSTMGDAIFFFRFFAMQIVFYGISTIVSGLLNASRDYLGRRLRLSSTTSS